MSYVKASGWDSARVERVCAALAAERSDSELTFERLAEWHRIAMGAGEIERFRVLPAFAKGGRERYGVDATTAGEFANCLREGAEPGMAPAARAARVYLDVCFFHPFSDGNGRAAMLAFDHVLGRAGVVLDQAGPVFAVSRRADDPEGARELVRLVDILIAATESRAR
ncbi:Fic family protein [Nocardia sp. NPDC057668]|uniref:Fic family protein n=1 Tax=Nocardia sp. NPDC057668 TaxID=3346202 RepID=UPI00366F718F